MKVFCKNKTDVVQYASDFLRKLEVVDFAWTMTIQQGKLEDCYATIAITDLLVDGEDKTSMYLEELLGILKLSTPAG